MALWKKLTVNVDTGIKMSVHFSGATSFMAAFHSKLCFVLVFITYENIGTKVLRLS